MGILIPEEPLQAPPPDASEADTQMMNAELVAAAIADGTVTALTGPDWVAGLREQTLRTLHRYRDTMMALLKEPEAFFAAWLAGTRQAVNPGHFGVDAFAVSATAFFLTAPSVSFQLQAHWWAGLLFNAAVYLTYGALAFAAHLALGPLRKRVPLRTMLAAVLYAAGSIGLVASLVFALAGPILGVDYRNLAASYQAHPFQAWTLQLLALSKLALPVWWTLRMTAAFTRPVRWRLVAAMAACYLFVLFPVNMLIGSATLQLPPAARATP